MKRTGWFTYLDRRIVRWMAEHGILLLRVSVGLVFVWFGALKFIPGLSPADELATDTINVLTFGTVGPELARILLATVETGIGLGLIAGRFLRLVLLALYLQLLGTAAPMFLFPELTFERVPLVPTLEGQYIIKNLVLVAAGIVIGATVRGGDLVDDPVVTAQAEVISSRSS